MIDSINSSSSGSSAGVDGSVNSGASAVERHYRSDALTPEEERIIIDTGKAMKMSGDVVNGAVLSTAYCRHFLSSKRDPKVLAEKWQKWFRNQRKSPGTAYHRTSKRNTSTRSNESSSLFLPVIIISISNENCSCRGRSLLSWL